MMSLEAFLADHVEKQISSGGTLENIIVDLLRNYTKPRKIWCCVSECGNPVTITEVSEIMIFRWTRSAVLLTPDYSFFGASSPYQYSAVTPPSMRKSLPVINEPSAPIRSAPMVPTSSEVPAVATGQVLCENAKDILSKNSGQGHFSND